jgi:choline kinase
MNRLAGSGANVRVVSIEGLDWGELDFAADLAPARAMAAAWQESEAAAEATAKVA